jgi:Cullin family
VLRKRTVSPFHHRRVVSMTRKHGKLTRLHRALQKLKTECGYQFTCKLEGMFTDMKTSADTMAAFRQHVKDEGIDLRADLSVHVRFATLSVSFCVGVCQLSLQRSHGSGLPYADQNERSAALRLHYMTACRC